MLRYLVAYASREGQTEKVAHHVARRLEDDGQLVRLIDIKTHETEAGADDCDAMLIAGSIHLGQFDTDLADFVMRMIGEEIVRQEMTSREWGRRRRDPLSLVQFRDSVSLEAAQAVKPVKT